MTQIEKKRNLNAWKNGVKTFKNSQKRFVVYQKDVRNKRQHDGRSEKGHQSEDFSTQELTKGQRLKKSKRKVLSLEK